MKNKKRTRAAKRIAGLKLVHITALAAGGLLALAIIMWMPPVFAAIPSGPGYDIIIVAGQSNAAGHGLGPVTNPGPTERDADIFQVGRYGANNMQVVSGTSIPLEFWNRDGTTYGNFAVPFARYYANARLASDRKILIIPAAQGGTSILSWLKVRSTPDNLWSDMSLRTQFALSQPGGNNKVVAVLWQQGEEDVQRTLEGKTDMNAAIYHDKLTELVNKFRSQYGANTLVFLGEMAPSWLQGEPGFATKTDFIASIKAVSRELAYVGFVSSTGLLTNSEAKGGHDDIHFSSESLSILGKRYFDSYCAIDKVCRAQAIKH